MQKTSIDWFAFRGKGSLDVFASAFEVGMPEHLGVYLEPLGRGYRSFESSFDVWAFDRDKGPDPASRLRIGRAMTGGDLVKGWSLLSITGAGCSWVEDWSKVMDACQEKVASFELKRVDVALDRFDGSHWEDVDEAWRAGEFSPPGGGKWPKVKVIDTRRDEDGRSYYVGSRDSAKFYRGYEKGLQMLGPELARAGSEDEVLSVLQTRKARISEDRKSACLVKLADWWRDEVEFKPVNQPLPLDLVENRDGYFSGAYPYLAKVLPSVEAAPLITRRERMPQVDLAKALAQVRKQYGSTLYTALRAYHGDIGAVWDKVCGVSHSRALVDAGVLMVEHE